MADTQRTRARSHITPNREVRDAIVARHHRHIMPLDEFEPSHLARITADIESPHPPERWRAVGTPASTRPLAWIPNRSWFEWHWFRGISPGTSRTRLPESVRTAVINRDGLVCQLCGGDVLPGDVHIDHVVPWSRGGQHTLGNLQVAHSRCNIRKGARD